MCIAIYVNLQVGSDAYITLGATKFKPASVERRGGSLASTCGKIWLLVAMSIATYGNLQVGSDAYITLGRTSEITAMPRTNPDSEENIRRIDSSRRTGRGGGTHGFQVHFNRAGINYTRLVSDAPSGGKEKARERAREFREILRSAIPPTLNGPARSGPAQSNTGHMGISISGASSIDNTGPLMVQANVRIAKGKPLNKKFYLKDSLDLRAAIEKAIAWRNEALETRAVSERAA